MDGSNKRGRPHREWSDDIEQWCGATLQELSYAALDRQRWAAIVTMASDMMMMNLTTLVTGLVDSKSLDAFHIKCQRRVLGISSLSWHQFVRNEEIATRTGLPPLSTTICCRRSAIFGHLARLGDEVPAHKALHSCIRLSQGRLPDPTWKRRPGRPRGRWIDQLRRDSNLLINGTWLLNAVTAEERRYGLRTTRPPDLT